MFYENPFVLSVFGFSGLLLFNAGIWTARMTILDREVTKLAR